MGEALGVADGLGVADAVAVEDGLALGSGVPCAASTCPVVSRRSAISWPAPNARRLIVAVTPTAVAAN
jgi:hypothetical protein